MTLDEYAAKLALIEADPSLAAMAGDPIFWLRKMQRELRDGAWNNFVRAEVNELLGRVDALIASVESR